MTKDGIEIGININEVGNYTEWWCRKITGHHPTKGKEVTLAYFPTDQFTKRTAIAAFRRLLKRKKVAEKNNLDK